MNYKRLYADIYSQPKQECIFDILLCQQKGEMQSNMNQLKCNSAIGSSQLQ